MINDSQTRMRSDLQNTDTKVDEASQNRLKSWTVEPRTVDRMHRKCVWLTRINPII